MSSGPNYYSFGPHSGSGGFSGFSSFGGFGNQSYHPPTHTSVGPVHRPISAASAFNGGVRVKK